MPAVPKCSYDHFRASIRNTLWRVHGSKVGFRPVRFGDSTEYFGTQTRGLVNIPARAASRCGRGKKKGEPQTDARAGGAGSPRGGVSTIGFEKSQEGGC